MDFRTRLQHGWNAFMNKDPTRYYSNLGGGYTYRPDRPRMSRGNERSIVASIINRIAMDGAAISIEHVKIDDEGRYIETVDDALNQCLTVSANIDQTGRAFIHDALFSMMDEGVVALVPVVTVIDPENSESYIIESMRVGKITEWFPKHVRVKLYDERIAEYREIVVPKKTTAIVENPLFAVMNEPNSTIQRLKHKLRLLDAIDEQSSSGKLDLIIQLPYTIKSPARREQAEQRRKDIEMQLAGSRYGIAYTDGTERITQLNRPLENNLLKQIEYLTSMAYAQLGLTTNIMDGTADEKTMSNYYSRTIEPMLSALVDEMKRKFLSKTARTRKHSICFFRDPFKLVPANELAELADKLTRNEIVSKNEIRQVIGLKPSKDPKADQLINSNISQPQEQMKPSSDNNENQEEGGQSQNGEV